MLTEVILLLECCHQPELNASHYQNHDRASFYWSYFCNCPLTVELGESDLDKCMAIMSTSCQSHAFPIHFAFFCIGFLIFLCW